MGGIYGTELPDPFPNSEVKRARADDSLVHASAKVGSCPYNKRIRLKADSFVIMGLLFTFQNLWGTPNCLGRALRG